MSAGPNHRRGHGRVARHGCGQARCKICKGPKLDGEPTIAERRARAIRAGVDEYDVERDEWRDGRYEREEMALIVWLATDCDGRPDAEDPALADRFAQVVT